MSEMKRFVDVVNSVHEKYKEEYKKIASKEKEDLIKELYKNDFPVVEFINKEHKSKGYSYAPEYLMAITKIQSDLECLLWLETYKYFNEYQLIKELEGIED